MIGKNFSLLLYLKKPKNYTQGPIPIYMRISADGRKTEICMSRHCEPELWDSRSQKAIGRKEAPLELNAHLETLRTKVYETRTQLINRNQSVTSAAIKQILTGKQERGKMLLSVFRDHNSQMESLIGIDFAPGTLQRFKTSFAHLQAFLHNRPGSTDLPVGEVNYGFIADYEYWRKKTKGCGHNTALKYMSDLRKSINQCIRNGWLTKDPFSGYRMTRKEVHLHPLSVGELHQLKTKSFEVKRLAVVRDVSVFSCFTGLCYADVSKLKPSELICDNDRQMWIVTSRQKTDVLSNIPLLAPALKIIERYRSHLSCKALNKVLPVCSNQKMNAYLKEIADLCSLEKRLTFHLARHTFATTVTLGNGVPIESVAKMLGHKKLSTTQHYAKVLNRKLGEDMQKLGEKFL